MEPLEPGAPGGAVLRGIVFTTHAACDGAERGFVVDDSFADATAENAKRFAMFPATAAIFLPGGAPVLAARIRSTLEASLSQFDSLVVLSVSSHLSGTLAPLCA